MKISCILFDLLARGGVCKSDWGWMRRREMFGGDALDEVLRASMVALAGSTRRVAFLRVKVGLTAGRVGDGPEGRRG